LATLHVDRKKRIVGAENDHSMKLELFLQWNVMASSLLLLLTVI